MPAFVSNNNFPIVFGRHYTAPTGGGYEYPSNAEFDDIAIYNRALTDAEVQALYTFQPGVPEISVSSMTTYPSPLLVGEPAYIGAGVESIGTADWKRPLFLAWGNASGHITDLATWTGTLPSGQNTTLSRPVGPITSNPGVYNLALKSYNATNNSYETHQTRSVTVITPRLSTNVVSDTVVVSHGERLAMSIVIPSEISEHRFSLTGMAAVRLPNGDSTNVEMTGTRVNDSTYRFQSDAMLIYDRVGTYTIQGIAIFGWQSDEDEESSSFASGRNRKYPSINCNRHQNSRRWQWTHRQNGEKSLSL
jgi:hypothetical protein